MHAKRERAKTAPLSTMRSETLRGCSHFEVPTTAELDYTPNFDSIQPKPRVSEFSKKHNFDLSLSTHFESPTELVDTVYHPNKVLPKVIQDIDLGKRSGRSDHYSSIVDASYDIVSASQFLATKTTADYDLTKRTSREKHNKCNDRTSIKEVFDPEVTFTPNTEIPRTPGSDFQKQIGRKSEFEPLSDFDYQPNHEIRWKKTPVLADFEKTTGRKEQRAGDAPPPGTYNPNFSAIISEQSQAVPDMSRTSTRESASRVNNRNGMQSLIDRVYEVKDPNEKKPSTPSIDKQVPRGKGMNSGLFTTHREGADVFYDIKAEEKIVTPDIGKMSSRPPQVLPCYSNTPLNVRFDAVEQRPPAFTIGKSQKMKPYL
eukprot:TRINITY_DN2580_c0_g1_i4.p1 TRINITY_DN2580_c0_g1~~TRINITY_DN2580_c0_g1_i4.p1  ORF type:complete len:371 (+),score=94.33 TRINITY_DN2580_c0_g1_i4:1508-2620(+)